jgi:hypothetical protein
VAVSDCTSPGHGLLGRRTSGRGKRELAIARSLGHTDKGRGDGHVILFARSQKRLEQKNGRARLSASFPPDRFCVFGCREVGRYPVQGSDSTSMDRCLLLGLHVPSIFSPRSGHVLHGPTSGSALHPSSRDNAVAMFQRLRVSSSGPLSGVLLSAVSTHSSTRSNRHADYES